MLLVVLCALLILVGHKPCNEYINKQMNEQKIKIKIEHGGKIGEVRRS